MCCRVHSTQFSISPQISGDFLSTRVSPTSRSVSYILRWRDRHTVDCGTITLVMDALFWIRLPVITDFTAIVQSCPSKQASSSLVTIQTSIISHIQELHFEELYGGEDDTLVLAFEDLQSLMAFSNLHHIDLDLTWKVNLTDSKLLALALTWPRLKWTK